MEETELGALYMGRMDALVSLGRGFLRRIYTLIFLGLRRLATSFCMVGTGLGALQGIGRLPWRPSLSVAFSAASAGRFVALPFSADPQPNALQGIGRTPWRSLVSADLPVSFAWQDRDLVFSTGWMYALGSMCRRNQPI